MTDEIGTAMHPSQSATTFCRLCEPQCGLTVRVGEDGGVEVRGDPENPHSRGYFCVKARALGDMQTDPDRLRHPLRRDRRTGHFERVAWENALDEIAARLSSVVQDSGPRAVAAYLGNPQAFSIPHAAYARWFLRALGTNHLYTPMSQDGGSRLAASALLYGSPMTLPIPDLSRTRFLIVIGANPLVSNGSVLSQANVGSELRGIVRRGGRVVVIDPRRSETARAFEHVPIRGGTDAWFLLSLLHVLFRDGLVDRAFVAAHTTGAAELAALVAAHDPARTETKTGVPPERTQELAHALARSGPGAIYGRTGTCTQAFGTLVNLLQDCANILTGNLDRPGGWVFPFAADPPPGAPSQAAQGSYGSKRSRIGGFPDVMGTLPAALLAREITTPGEGQIRALITSAGNPMLSVPSAGLGEALRSLDLHVSIDIYLNETGRHADFVLPAATMLEREDMTVLGSQSPAPFVQVTRAVVDRPTDVREEWEIFRDLGSRLDLGEPPPGPQVIMEGALRGLGSSWQELEEHYPHGKILAARPRTGVLDRWISHADGRVHLSPPELAAEHARLIEPPRAPSNLPLRLIGLRETRSLNSWMHNLRRLRGSPKATALRIHPDDAERFGVTDGGRARLRSRSGAITVTVCVTDEMVPGTVAHPHGWGHEGGWRLANASDAESSNCLADTAPESLERCAGMAVLNGIPVSITPLKNRKSSGSAHGAGK